MNDETETPENVEAESTPENVDDAPVENISSENDRLTMLEIRVDHLLHSEEHRRMCFLHSEEHKRMCVENHG